MKTQLLRDKDIFPSPEVLQHALGKRCHAVLEELLDTLTGEDFGLTFEWRFYNDGKAWLGKAVYKKKTIFWLSVWDGYFQTGFYFTEKTRAGVMELEIDDTIKNDFATAEATGKLIPLSLKIDKKRQLKDVLKIVGYKKALK